MSAEFISGGAAVAALVIALFFIRFWRQTGDSLFGMFAAGFVTFGLSRFILAFVDEDDEGRVLIYALRLAAFALILAAIINKNRTPRGLPLASAGNGSRPDVRERRRPYTRS